MKARSAAIPAVLAAIATLAPALHAGPMAGATSDRAVVVIQGGGAPHPYSTPWAACDGGRPQFV